MERVSKKFGVSQKQVINILSTKGYIESALETFPLEISQFILRDTKVRDILNYCSANKNLMYVCQDDNFWKTLLMRDYGQTPFEKTSAKETYKYITITSAQVQKYKTK